MVEAKKVKPEILKFVQLRDGFIIMVYRLSKVLHFRKVGHAEPLRLKPEAIKRELGWDRSYSEEGVNENLSKVTSPFKLFNEFIVQPKGGRIIGIFRHPIEDQTIFRVIGFTNPEGLNKRYKEILAEKGKPESEPYWQFYGLGREWRGGNVTRESDLFTLIISPSETKTFEVEEVFKERI